MASRKRKLQKDATQFDPASDREVKLIEDFLLMVRRRMEVSHDAGMSRVRLEMITPEQAEVLIDLLERACR